MNTPALLQQITAALQDRDAQIVTLTAERDTARAAYTALQNTIDNAQTQVIDPTPPAWTPPVLDGPNSSDLSNWSHTGAFGDGNSSFEVQRHDGTDWTAIGTGINNGDTCRIRSVHAAATSEWVEFNA